jgi:hypothetical protein
MSETYFIDGVYKSIEGGKVKLRTPREEGGDHVVYVEPEVWREMKEQDIFDLCRTMREGRR